MIERAFDEILEGLSLDKLHRVKVTLGASAQMEDRGNIRVTKQPIRLFSSI